MLHVAILLQVVLVLGLAQPSSLADQLVQLVDDLKPLLDFKWQLFLELAQNIDELMGVELQPDVYEMFARQTCTERATSWLLRVLQFQFPVELTERHRIVILCILLAKRIPDELMTSDLLMAVVQHDCFPRAQYDFCELIQELPGKGVSKLEPIFRYFLSQQDLGMCQMLAKKLKDYQNVLYPIAIGASLSLPPSIWAAVFAAPGITAEILDAYLNSVVEEERRGALRRAVIIRLAIGNEIDICFHLLWHRAVPLRLRSNKIRSEPCRQVLGMLAHGEMQLDEVLDSIQPQSDLMVALHFFILPAWHRSRSPDAETQPGQVAGSRFTVHDQLAAQWVRYLLDRQTAILSLQNPKMTAHDLFAFITFCSDQFMDTDPDIGVIVVPDCVASLPIHFRIAYRLLKSTVTIVSHMKRNNVADMAMYLIKHLPWHYPNSTKSLLLALDADASDDIAFGPIIGNDLLRFGVRDDSSLTLLAVLHNSSIRKHLPPEIFLSVVAGLYQQAGHLLRGLVYAVSDPIARRMIDDACQLGMKAVNPSTDCFRFALHIDEGLRNVHDGNLISDEQDDEKWTCSVCLDGSGPSFRRACGHKLHLPCILGLIESNHSCPCPECRAMVLINPDQVVRFLERRREPLPSDCFLQIRQ